MTLRSHWNRRAIRRRAFDKDDMKAYTVRQILLVIVCSLVVPAFIIGLEFSYSAYLDGSKLIKEQALQATRSLLLDVDAEFKALDSMAVALATSPALRRRELATFYEQARKALGNSTASNLVLTDADGQQVLNTLLPFGAALPRHGNPALLARAAASGRPVISDLYLGAVAHSPVMSICVPVWEDHRLVYFIDLGVKAARFSRMLSASKLPADWVISIFDGRGVIVARSQAEQRFVGQKGAAVLLRDMAANLEGNSSAVTLEGIPVYTSYSRSMQSGWRVAIGVPTASVNARLWKLLGLTLGSTVLLLGIGLWLAGRASNYIQRSINDLLAMSAALGRGQPVVAGQTRLVEAGYVAAALTRSADMLGNSERGRSEAEAALRKANAELEQRILERAAELRQSRHLLAAIIEFMPAMVFVMRTDDLRYLMLNRAGELLLGLPREEVVNRTDADLFSAEQAAARMAAARQALDSTQVVDIDEEPALLPSGALRYLRTRRIALRDAEGRATHLLGISLDITDSSLAAEQLRIAAVAFESQEAMLITDEHNVIVRVNQAFSTATGYEAAEVLGRTPQMLQSGRHDAAFYADMWDAIHHQGSWQGELWDRRKNDEIYPTWTTISAIRDSRGRICNYVCAQTDISARKQAEEEIRQLAFFDPLTHLPNRRLLLDRLRHVIDGAARNGKFSALMFIDLDNFKLLNDTLGHDQGDRLLQQVAQRLPGCVRAGDTVARLGGDEFVVMLEELSADSKAAALHAQAIGEDILVELNRPYQLAGRSCRCTPSIGVTMFSDHHVSVDDLLKRADLAMYQAKAQGRNTLRFFEPSMQTLVNAQAEMEHELHEALSHGDFELYYQAQVDHDGRVTGAEALLRWNHARRGLIEPDQFIGLAEDTGFILPLGQWVLQQACAQLAAWSRLPAMVGLSIAINVSSRQFLQTDFVEQVFLIVDHSGADPHKLKFELTESLLLDDLADIVAKMGALKQRGIGLALDDFGTGYSSLSYLKRLPLDQLKIDRSFSRDILSDSNDAAIARIIVALGHTLGLSIIAEGVETEDQRSFLAEHHCNLYQGFLFSRPLPERAFRDFVRDTLAPAA
jgi:diguanylate cyclase (GGDEF)-like protein/PAS domain S-box-containing protein